MLEVIPHGNGFRWRWIGFCGRTLIDNFECHPDTGLAFAAARLYRTVFWAWADTIDHRQGRCV